MASFEWKFVERNQSGLLHQILHQMEPDGLRITDKLNFHTLLEQ